MLCRSRTSVVRVREEFQRQGYNMLLINKTLDSLVSRAEFRYQDRRQTLVRAR